MADNLKYEQINWGWLNDYSGYKFAPITFYEKLYTEQGKSFKELYDGNIEALKDGTFVVGAAKTLVQVDGKEIIPYHYSNQHQPICFSHGMPVQITDYIEGIDIKNTYKNNGSVDKKVTVNVSNIIGDTYKFNNPLNLKIGNKSKTLSEINETNNSLTWNSNEIGFFGFLDVGTEIEDGTDLNGLVEHNSYYTEQSTNTKTLKNLPDAAGIDTAAIRLLVLTHYKNKRYSGTKQVLFNNGHKIFIRSAYEKDGTRSWNNWDQLAFLSSKVADASHADKADQADKLSSKRTIALNGMISGSSQFDGSANITITTTLANELKFSHSFNKSKISSSTESSSRGLNFYSNDGQETKFLTGRVSNVCSYDSTDQRFRSYMRLISFRPDSEDVSTSKNYAQLYVFADNNGKCEAGVKSNTLTANDKDPWSGGNIVFMGAAWNDYAEFRDQITTVEPGYCVASTNDGKVYKTTEKLQACDGIVSDTYGFAIGRSDTYQTPLAVSGRVLAYCEGNRYDYQAGDTVCAGPEGKVCKMTREEIKEWPDRIIGIVSEIPEYEVWGTGNTKVNGRIWIKVK